jgi:streptogramin lyase
VAADVVQGVCCNCGLAGHSDSDCVTQEIFPGLGKGPNGVWLQGEREVWVRSLPPDKVAAIVDGVKKKMAAKKAARASTLLQRTSRVSTRGSPLAPFAQ